MFEGKVVVITGGGSGIGAALAAELRRQCGADPRALPRPAEPGVRWVPEENWHVTLRFLGDADPTEVARGLTTASLPSATARLGPVVSRLGLDVVVVPCRGLDALAAVVVEATADLGRPPDPRPFHGHLTLARLRHRVACGVTGTRFGEHFVVDEIAIVSSRSDENNHDGPRYEIVERIPTTEEVR